MVRKGARDWAASLRKLGWPAVRAGRGAGALGLQRLQRTDPQRATYNSFNGRFSDNPRGIYEELARGSEVTKHVWIGAPGHVAPPTGTVAVAPYSLGYLREVGRSGLVVSNLPMPTNFRKPPGATYLQTWHGTPLKRIGYDNDRWRANPKGLERMRRDFDQWDHLVSQNAFSTEIFRRTFRFEGEILEEGYPRNDVLSRPEATEIRRRVRTALGIEAHQRVVLYAPTWRETLFDSEGSLTFKLALDVERMAARLGGDHVLLLRLHYLLASRLGDVDGPFALNVSDEPDIRELYLAADVLITDYSSAMFDFAVTGKPIIFFTYDLTEYRDGARGFYFDFEAEAPGPLCQDTDEVISALADLDRVSRDHSDRYVRFCARYCPHDDGEAARRIVARVMRSCSSGGP